ncbi:putative membrane protein [Micromonospora kangleipakensis]|uniref:Putative membrane protein n=1 Tax=Micromonospora kangleipakensis TaxID=1077942 RepID=A0A4Q8BFY3_9ACTN|nr:TMEM175 family protein [Micromonospora kangleipakensis]RZU76109.1 putative membrane protein [Micromonospora kangleipakensis]
MSAGPEEVQPRGPARLADIGRLAAFSDGVFAIVITLLVLDLRVPEYHQGELLTSLVREGPSYLAFVVSFVYIGVLWLNHHALLRLVRGTTLTLSWINISILFGVVIIPFPTAVLSSALVDGDTDDLRVAVVMYALAAALMSAPWLVFFAYLRRHPTLRAGHIDQDHVHAQEARPITGLVLYGLAGLLGWIVNPLLGLLGIIVMIIFHGLTSEGLRTGPLQWVRTGRRG